MFVTIPLGGRGVARAPGLAYVVCYVVLIGNQWVSDWVMTSFSGNGVPLSSVPMFPRWRLSPHPGDEWDFWALDLRAVLFVALMAFGLRRLARSSLGTGAFAALVGTTVLAASVAAVTGALLTTLIAGQPNAQTDFDYAGEDFFGNLVVAPLVQATLFGLLFGVVFATFIAREYRTRPAVGTDNNESLSLW